MKVKTIARDIASSQDDRKVFYNTGGLKIKNQIDLLSGSDICSPMNQSLRGKLVKRSNRFHNDRKMKKLSTH